MSYIATFVVCSTPARRQTSFRQCEDMSESAPFAPFFEKCRPPKDALNPFFVSNMEGFDTWFRCPICGDLGYERFAYSYVVISSWVW